MSNKAIFLDRDGTLIENINYLKDINNIKMLDGVREVLFNLLKNGYLLFLFTNQRAIGNKYLSLKDVNICNQHMIQMLNLPFSVIFTEICVAPETENIDIVYRKPSPRFIIEMINKYNLNKNQCWMIGDKMSDAIAGINANINGVLLTKENMEFDNNLFHKCDNLLDFYNKFIKIICDAG